MQDEPQQLNDAYLSLERSFIIGIRKNANCAGSWGKQATLRDPVII